MYIMYIICILIKYTEYTEYIIIKKNMQHTNYSLEKLKE